MGWNMQEKQAIDNSNATLSTHALSSSSASLPLSNDLSRPLLHQNEFAHCHVDEQYQEDQSMQEELVAQERQETLPNSNSTSMMESTSFSSTSRFVAISIAIVDTSASLAAGMSIRFFPIFFMHNLNLHPTMVQVLYLVCPLGQIVLAKVAQSLALRRGRAQVTVLMKWIGILMMLSMVLVYQHNSTTATPVNNNNVHQNQQSVLLSTYIYGLQDGGDENKNNQTTTGSSVGMTNIGRILTCLLFVLRTSFMNCTQALTKSMLMDAVPSYERGRWSALEGLNSASWSGSAFVGGLFVARFGMVSIFYATATLQFLSTLPLIPLFRRVPPAARSS
jgi:hypothetical protein